jgi:colanic acid/amylovoran biosynthesis glycosyltransferase
MKVRYLVSSFPALTETFIRTEVEDHLAAGLDFDIVALHPPRDRSAVETLPAELRRRVHYASPSRSQLDRLLAAARAMGGAPARRALFPKDRALRSRPFDLAAVAGLWRRLGPDPDLVHAHFGRLGLAALALRDAGVTRARIATTFHGRDVTVLPARRGEDVYAGLLARTEAFLPVNHAFAARLQAMGADPARIHVQRAPVRIAGIPFHPPTLAPGEPVRLICVGRLQEKKGQAVALRALARLATEDPSVDYRLSIVGGGGLADSLAQLAAGLGVADRVEFLGPRPHAETLERLEAAHIFVLPSLTGADGDQEGVPVSIMEAMAAGLPVVSTQHSGIPELVADRVTGALANEGDDASLARAIAWTAAEAPHWPQMGVKARQIVEREFDVGATGPKLRALYGKILR